MSREEIALQPPAGRNLAGFPTAIVPAVADLYRAHRRELGPWFFSSSGAGRFDLNAGRGTCYLAADSATAIREVLGTTLHQLGFVPGDFARARVVSCLHLPSDHRVADLCSTEAADFGLTREIHTLVPYRITQAWAAALDTVVDGLRYQSRFTTDAVANAFAVFAAAGPTDWRRDRKPASFASAARAVGLRVVDPPKEVTIIRPNSD